MRRNQAEDENLGPGKGTKGRMRRERAFARCRLPAAAVCHFFLKLGSIDGSRVVFKDDLSISHGPDRAEVM